ITQLIQQSGIKIKKEDDIESICSIEDEPSKRTISQAQKDCDNRILVTHILVRIYSDKY
ncbi:hypothetical protein J1N35_037407, partial [Gossypium stocksii]